MSRLAKTSFTVLVRDLVHRPGEQRELELDASATEPWGAGVAVVPAGAPVELRLRLESVHEGILVSGDAATTAEAECVRCLRELRLAVEVVFQELFAYPGSDGFDHQVHDDHVDLEPVVRDEVVLALPFQPVCPEGCRPVETGEGVGVYLSGDPLPEQVDPRWAALADFVAQGRDGGESEQERE